MLTTRVAQRLKSIEEMKIRLNPNRYDFKTEETMQTLRAEKQSIISFKNELKEKLKEEDEDLDSKFERWCRKFIQEIESVENAQNK